MVEIQAPSSWRARSGRPRATQRGTDPRAQLRRRLPRVGDHEDRLDVEAVVADGAHEPLDEHGGLPRPGAGGDEDLAVRLDRGQLLLVHHAARHPAHRPEVAPGRALAALRVVRHVAAPDPLRRRPRARSRAVSTWPQNCSSSR